MKKEDPIGFLDSGLGGLTVLATALDLLPYENYVYYGDSLHNPYGDKSKAEIKKYVFSSIDFLIQKGCKAIVIACNTASSLLIKEIKATYKDFIFISTVPALKVALDEDRKQNILVMATEQAIKSPRMLQFYKEYEEEMDHIYLLSCKGLAELIEDDDNEKTEAYLTKKLFPYQNKKINRVVLGCTHYPFVREQIEKILKPAKTLEGSFGIIKELRRQLQLRNLLNEDTTIKKVIIYNSKGSEKIEKSYEMLCRYRNQ